MGPLALKTLLEALAPRVVVDVVEGEAWAEFPLVVTPPDEQAESTSARISKGIAPGCRVEDRMPPGERRECAMLWSFLNPPSPCHERKARAIRPLCG